MARYRSVFLYTIAFGSFAVAQGGLIRIPSDVAASHLKSSPAPDYPSLAQTARIQGNVILQIAIDTDGNVSPLRVVRGHPMLVPAAVSGVRNWKYSPFTANGQSISAVSVVVVRFGNPVNHDAEDKAEVTFQDTFWKAIDRAQAALGTGDLAAAEQEITAAQTLLARGGGPPVHTPERWQWTMSMGELNRRQNRFLEAEQRYMEALTLQKGNKNGPDAAASLVALGELYFVLNKLELAHDSLMNAILVYQKNYKAAERNPSIQQLYAREIANASWVLSKIAANVHRQDEATRQCRNMLDYKNALGSGDPRIEECERLLATPNSSIP